uniref:B box-type domain-containing protein n=2 Tax=Theileria parva TaxID=5875 RepID=Q4N6I3_THEPA|eukprot:XP_766708.1 hypothetical protein [Theileria parva strain Muguga]
MGTRVPQLTKSVIDSFGKVLDIFDENIQLRIPPFDPNTAYTDPTDTTDTPVVSEFQLPFNVEFLGKRTLTHYNKYLSRNPLNTVDTGDTVTGDTVGLDTRLCTNCYMSLGTAYCSECSDYVCNTCAKHCHGDRVTPVPMECLTLSLTTLPKSLVYEDCTVHSGDKLMFSCVNCHFLPLCPRCKVDHDTVHRVIVLELAVTEVKEFINDCVTSLLERSNSIAPVVPELNQLLHSSKSFISFCNRSLRCGLQSVNDSIHNKQSAFHGEINNLQLLSSNNLNKLLKLSNKYDKYLLGKMDQLRQLSGIKDPGLGLNMFVELKDTYESLLWHNEDLPDLTLEIPHWQLNTGNVNNLLADTELRINHTMELFLTLFQYIKEDSTRTKECILNIVKHNPVRGSKDRVSRDSRDSKNSVGDVGDVLSDRVMGPDTVTQMTGVFWRKDYIHRIVCKRTIQLHNHKLYVLSHHTLSTQSGDITHNTQSGDITHTTDSIHTGDVESVIDLGSVWVRGFEDGELSEFSKLVRVGAPNGFELVEQRRNQMRVWSFTNESRHLVLLWTSKLKVASANARKLLHKVDLTQLGLNKDFVLPVPPTKNINSNVDSGNNSVKSVNNSVNSVNSGVNSVKSTVGTMGIVEREYNFKEVSEALKKIKQDSTLLYDKCFHTNSPKSHNTVNTVNSAVNNTLNSNKSVNSVDNENSVDSVLVCGGRYRIPSPSSVKRERAVNFESFESKGVEVPEFEFQPQITSPKSIHKFFLSHT